MTTIRFVQADQAGQVTGKPLAQIKDVAASAVVSEAQARQEGDTALDKRVAALETLPAAPADLLTRVEALEARTAVTATLDAEALARTQGYWAVVSSTEPTETTHTLSDGTVLPVVWQVIRQTVVPVIPSEPTWDDTAHSVLVPDLVGVDYVTDAGQTITPGAAVVLPGPVPFTVTITAQAQAGYSLPAAFSWTHTYPDPAAEVVVTSETFSGGDGPIEQGRWTDAALGGSPARWMLGQKTETVPPVVEVRDGAAVKLTPVEIAAIQEPQDWWQAIYLDTGVASMRVDFDLTVGETFQELIVQLRGAGPMSGTGFTFAPGSIDMRYPGGSDAETVYRGSITTGHYTLEAAGTTIAVTTPGQARYAVTRDWDAGSDKNGSLVSFAATKVAKTAATEAETWAIDNLVVTRVGA